MHSARPSVPPRARRYDHGRRTEAQKPPNHAGRREDKSVSSVASSPRRVTRGPPEPSRLKSQAPRSSVTQPRLARLQKNGAQPVAGNPKPKVGHAAKTNNVGPAAVDPNCNEPGLPCLCCDGQSHQDSNSLFNHNHNNNNTVAIRQQLKLASPPLKDKEEEKKPEVGRKAKSKPEEEQQPVSLDVPVVNNVEDKEEKNGNEDKQDKADLKDDEAGANLKGKVDENGNDHNHNEAPAEEVVEDAVVNDVVVDDNADDGDADDVDDADDDDDDDDDDDEDDNTLVPSCCDCPASMLDFSLTSSTSSSSTSISSCSDLESDCPDTFSLSLQEHKQEEHYPAAPHYPESHSSFFQPCSLPLDLSTSVRPPPSPCSPDEGYPSAPSSPSSDFIESKRSEEDKGIKVDLLNFLDSIDELGKVDRFYRIVQVARWELETDLDLRDRLVHQERLEKVNKQVKLVHLERLQEAGLELDEEDLSGVLDEMGNIDLSWKMYKSDQSSDSQEYSDAGVDMTAPSDLDEPSAPDSLVPSPVDPPPRPPKPPARHISAQPELHTYMNISGNTPSVSSPSSPVKSFSLVVSASEPPPPPSASALASKPPALPPPPSQPVPYFTLYSDSPSFPSPTPPIPPPRRRHKARLEAQRLAELAKEKTPQSLPAPTSRPPPLPPPPTVQPSPPVIPPPPSLPPPPSFHALDVEIRKLLALAGITQAELLRLSPELGVCVDGVLEESEMSEISKTHKDMQKEDVDQGSDLSWRDELRKEDQLGKGVKDLETSNKEKNEESVEEMKERSKDTFKTTSFTEMARRRRRNGGSSNSSCGYSYGDNDSLASDSYYSTDISNKHLPNVSHGSFDYASMIPDSPPPPPPPRPLPPRPQILSNPPELPPIKPCTLMANASRPDRFDWLIAFTPDTETPPLAVKKSTEAVPQKASTGPKVTTFKELRNRGKQVSPPTQVQDPEPSVVTPDPDFLYNLKWRREKADGDGTQWEYTSQAQATFLQPPPTPASLALFREMRHLNFQGDASLQHSIQNPTSRHDSHGFDQKAERKEDELEKTEVRGTADGGRTLESRTRVSSPPLSLAFPDPLPSSPYYLHSTPPSQPPLFYRSDFYRSQSKAYPFPQVSRIPTDSIRDTYPDSLYRSENGGEFSCRHKNPFSANANSSSSSIIDSLYQYSQYSEKKAKLQSYDYEKDSIHASNHFTSEGASCYDSNCNVDSLYCDNKYKTKTLTFVDFPQPDISTLTDGNTTPYKNIDMINLINAGKLNDLSDASAKDSSKVEESSTSWFATRSYEKASDKTMENKPQMFPTLYLYHPKNCPMHKGAPPRLSPVGAISPPFRAGSLSPGADVSRLASPLFPRSHTLPALAAPLYYPYLYTPRAPAPLPEPKLHSQQRPSPPLSLTVRSLSFAGSAAKAAWMGSDVRPPLRGDGLSSLFLQEKRALVSVVSVAVEAILAQFSSSRTLVQKFPSVEQALSGDSSVNPTLGRLVLQCLCPALRDLLSDGLKPHQSDLIAGRRPNSPWGLVQASTKPGSNTQALYILQAKVAALPQLKHSRHRFNSFLLGLLNIKRLDFWLSHLQSCSDVLETYYRPTAFMRLSSTSCQHLFEELLLLLQPLSLLTFNLDLLFQHHHLDPSSPDLTPVTYSSPGMSRPPNRGFSFHLLPTYQSEASAGHLKGASKQEPAGVQSGLKSSSSTLSFSPAPVQVQCRPPAAIAKGETSPQLQWLKEKEIEAPPSDGSGNSLSQQAGQALQQGWGAVMRWGERLGQNLGGLASAGWSEEGKGFDTVRDLNTYPATNALKSPGQEDMMVDGVPWGLGRLFGASKSPSNPPSKRRPSQWLSPGITALTRMTGAGHAFLPDKIEPGRKEEKEKDRNEERKQADDQPKPLRAVRTLCDHAGTGAELTFRKGEELIVLGGVDQDWIRCRQGDKEGLVPIGYASLIA
ncbi:uncharacterized protein rusc1 isoform X1 [Astyanax mexicanus]|uniref:uncharacterized protein rusc1 isoform X1 n=1 Tax=Astyanax mexicanus TaxID=7994 RepID=UPI0020CB29AB|nr:uncharacterized protein rusc1 isoform X1 [Astyanax mexicanus]